ncbi:Uncharacterised protein [Segatella copri]|nr:Uncharacterised protein [Segatella copri]
MEICYQKNLPNAAYNSYFEQQILSVLHYFFHGYLFYSHIAEQDKQIGKDHNRHMLFD